MDPFISKINKAIEEHEMIQPDDCVLVGVSGGPDSVALLYGLSELRDELSIELVIAHLNHSARGDESDRDAEFVKNLGVTLQLKTLIETIDVTAHQEKGNTSFQETARQLRQEFFQRAMVQVNANKIALGHTLDDQAETVLINLLRGSGLKGIGGMNPVRLPYIRPLFYCSRSEVIDFLEDRGIATCSDSSNEKTDYLRNRIRLELIPFLKEKYNPKIVENLFEASGIFRAENDYLKNLEDHEYERAVLPSNSKEIIRMDVSCVSALPLALKRRLLRKGILSVKGDLRRITSFHVKDALRLFDESQKGKKIDLPGNLRISCLGDCVEFKRILDSPSGILTNEESMKSDWKKPLIIPGETPVEDTGLTFRAEIIDPGDVEYSTDPSSQAFLDFEKTGKNIMIRFFQAGDRLTPFGMKGTKKLKSLFIDEKVPREIRSTIPILTTDDNDIIWVYGTRIADPYRVTSNTSKVLFIRGLS